MTRGNTRSITVVFAIVALLVATVPAAIAASLTQPPQLRGEHQPWRGIRPDSSICRIPDAGGRSITSAAVSDVRAPSVLVSALRMGKDGRAIATAGATHLGAATPVSQYGHTPELSG